MIEPCGERRMYSIISKRISAGSTPADCHQFVVEGTHVGTRADEPFDTLKLMDVTKHKEWLNIVRPKPLQMFEIEAWSRFGNHVGVRCLNLRISHMRTLNIRSRRHLDDVHSGGPNGNCHLIRLGVEFGEHMAGVVI